MNHDGTDGTCQNGWPGLDSDSPLLHEWIVGGGAPNLLLRNGSGGFLLVHYTLWHHENVEPLEARLGVYGYAYRDIRGGTDLSNHAGGLADDLNSSEHPLGERGTFTHKQTDAIRARLKLYRGALRWGGDYTERADEMHFEVNVPINIAEERARALMDTPRGKRILQANPGQARVILS